MEENQDQILQRELAKIGALGGFVGGFAPGAIGGYLGAKFSSRFLPTETHSETIDLQLPAAQALTVAHGVLQGIGRITIGETEPSTLPQLTAVVGSGALNMNPTIVAITIAPTSETASAASISAAAKEGLIKQHSAKKAVARVQELLAKALPGQP